MWCGGIVGGLILVSDSPYFFSFSYCGNEKHCLHLYHINANTMTTIATDEIEESIKSGYTLMDYPTDKKFNANTTVRVYQYYPDYLCDELGLSEQKLCFDCNESITSLWDYIKEKNVLELNAFKAYRGITKLTKPKTPYELLQLADGVASYWGMP